MHDLILAKIHAVLFPAFSTNVSLDLAAVNEGSFGRLRVLFDAHIGRIFSNTSAGRIFTASMCSNKLGGWLVYCFWSDLHSTALSYCGAHNHIIHWGKLDSYYVPGWSRHCHVSRSEYCHSLDSRWVWPAIVWKICWQMACVGLANTSCKIIIRSTMSSDLLYGPVSIAVLWKIMILLLWQHSGKNKCSWMPTAAVSQTHYLHLSRVNLLVACLTLFYMS